MKELRTFIPMTFVYCLALIPAAWGAEDFSMPFQCKSQFLGQARFTETTANYNFQGLCGYVDSKGNYSSVWTFHGTAAYAQGTPAGKGQEHYTFASPQGNGEMQLSMDCLTDPWIDEGICSRDSLRISWKGSVPPLLMHQFSPNGPIPPPFSAFYLRQDRQFIQLYKSQRQAYLADLQQDRRSKLTAQPKPAPEVIEQTVNAPFMPTILSPAENVQFVQGGPVLLMVKAPEKDSLGSVVQVEFQSCVLDPVRNTCNWTPRGAEGRVSVPDLLAGTYRLPTRIVGETGTWRLRVQRPADPTTRTPAGYPSLWRRFAIVSRAMQQGPARGPVFGR